MVRGPGSGGKHGADAGRRQRPRPADHGSSLSARSSRAFQLFRTPAAYSQASAVLLVAASPPGSVPRGIRGCAPLPRRYESTSRNNSLRARSSGLREKFRSGISPSRYGAGTSGEAFARWTYLPAAFSSARWRGGGKATLSPRAAVPRNGPNRRRSARSLGRGHGSRPGLLAVQADRAVRAYRSSSVRCRICGVLAAGSACRQSCSITSR